jgi:hypothetical protein
MLAIQIGDLVVGLASQDTAVLRGWRAVLAGWPILPYSELDLVLQLRAIDKLPAPPPQPPIYVQSGPSPGQAIHFAAYELENDQIVLYQPGLALLLLSLAEAASPAVTGFVTPQALRPDWLENILVQALPPLLRRRGYYMLHGFALVRSGRAILLVGQSHSGKTTTGLALLRAGGAFLSNDTVVLQDRPEGIYALPFPGRPGIRPYSFKLLPWLRDKSWEYVSEEQWLLQVTDWPGGWGEAAPVDLVYFPQIDGRGLSQRRPVSASAAVVRLLEQSVQKWDSGDTVAHLPFWEKLGRQITSYLVQLGEDAAQTADML